MDHALPAAELLRTTPTSWSVWGSGARCPAEVPADWICVPPTGPRGFPMGSPEDEPDRADGEVQHTVVLTRPFLLKRTEVTRAEWEALVGQAEVAAVEPSQPGLDCDTCPMDRATWLQVVAYANARSRSEGLEECYLLEADWAEWPRGLDCAGYRLPTHAEWEYAARAGTTTTYYFGDDPAGLTTAAWYDGNSGGRPHPAAATEALLDVCNAWDLCDMTGNVWEWVWDYSGEPHEAGVQVDPLGPDRPAELPYYHRVKGGAWYTPSRNLRHAKWGSYGGPDNLEGIGFRLARTVVP